MALVTPERDADPVPANPVARPEKKGGGERFHQLDGLRAVAVAIVMIHHSFSGPFTARMKATGEPAWDYLADLLLYTTGSGVELFFVLSGVVLLRPYVRGLRPFKPGTYFLRRIERLWPPFLAVLALEGLITWYSSRYPTWVMDPERARFSWQAFASHLSIVNFGTPIWNMAWWSLSVEVMFYLAVPLTLPLFVWRRMNRTMLLLLGAVLWIGGMATLRHVLDAHGYEQYTAWFNSFQKLAVYSLCFLMGIVIAKFDWSPRTGWALVGLGMLYILAAVAYPALNYHTGYVLFYGGIVMLAFVPRSVWQRLLSRHLMIWIGERSYSLFLIHFTVFFAVNYFVSLFLRQKDLVYFAVTRLIGLPLAVFAAMLLFQFVERRFARNLITANEFWPPLANPREQHVQAS